MLASEALQKTKFLSVEVRHLQPPPTALSTDEFLLGIRVLHSLKVMLSGS
jgi:hypothetical protein